MSFAAFPTKPVTPSRATEFRLPPQSAKREHRGARVYQPKSPAVTRPDTARIVDRPAPILDLPGLPPSPFQLPLDVNQEDSQKPGFAGSLIKNGKSFFKQFKAPWVKEVEDPLAVKIPPTPKTADWANEAALSYTPKGTPATATFNTFGLPKQFRKQSDGFAVLVNQALGKDPKANKGHIRHGSDENEEWNRDPPPLYKKNTPEGGIPAWSTVAAAFFVQFATIGYLFTWNVFEEYYTHHHLTDQSPIVIRLVGSIQWFLAFLMALVGGKLADMGYYQYVVLGGSVLFSASLFLLSFAPEESIALVFIFQGLLMGIAIGLVFVPTATVATRYFQRKRGFMIGVAMSGGSLGGMVFPAALRGLITALGFANAVRVTAIIATVFLAAANGQIHFFPLPQEEKPEFPPPRLDISRYSREMNYIAMIGAYAPFRYFLYLLLIFLAGSGFLAMLFIYYPAWYLQLAGVMAGLNDNVAFSSIIILSLTGIIGRIGFGYASDKFGMWNFVVSTSFFTAIMMFSVATVHATGNLVALSMFYGVFSSAWLSLFVTALTSFASRKDEVGTRVGLVLSIASFGQLFSDLIQHGALGSNFTWIIPSVISGFIFFGITGAMVFCWMQVAQKVPLSKRKYLIISQVKIIQFI